MNHSSVSSRRGTWLAVLAVAAASLLIRAPLAPIPLERDEGEYAYIAQRWRLGEVPYRESFDQKPPGVFVAYRVIQTVFGESPAAIHWGAQVYTLGTLAVIALLGRRLFSTEAGLLAALFAAYMTADMCVLGNAANTETFMILPIAASFLATLAARDTGRIGWALAAGVLGGLAFQFKQVALPNIAYHGLLLVMSRRPLVLAPAYVVGGALSAVPTIAYFWSHDAWEPFFDCVIGHNLSYAARVPLSEYWDWFVIAGPTVLGQWSLIVALAAVGLFTGPALQPREPDRRANRWIIAGWLAASAAGVAIGGYFRPHYFIQAIPAISILAGAGVLRLAARLAPRRTVAAAWLLAAVAVLFGICLAPWYYFTGDAMDKCAAIYRGNPFAESPAVAEFIASRSGPDDRVFIFGSEPQILYYAGRKSASRYIFVYPLMTPFDDTRTRQKEAFDELQRAKPRFVVVASQESSFFWDDLTPDLLQTEVERMLQSGYRLIGMVHTGDRTVRPYDGPTPSPALEPAPPAILTIWEKAAPGR